MEEDKQKLSKYRNLKLPLFKPIFLCSNEAENVVICIQYAEESSQNLMFTHPPHVKEK